MSEPSTPGGKDDGIAQGSVKGATASLLDSLRGLVADYLQLISLEIRLAGLSLTSMLAAAIVVGITIVSAWLCLITALAALYAAPETSWAKVLLIMTLLNLIVALLAMSYIRRRSRDLLFSRTRRHLSETDLRRVETRGPP